MHDPTHGHSDEEGMGYSDGSDAEYSGDPVKRIWLAIGIAFVLILIVITVAVINL